MPCNTLWCYISVKIQQYSDYRWYFILVYKFPAGVDILGYKFPEGVQISRRGTNFGVQISCRGRYFGVQISCMGRYFGGINFQDTNFGVLISCGGVFLEYNFHPTNFSRGTYFEGTNSQLRGDPTRLRTWGTLSSQDLVQLHHHRRMTFVPYRKARSINQG